MPIRTAEDIEVQFPDEAAAIKQVIISFFEAETDGARNKAQLEHRQLAADLYAKVNADVENEEATTDIPKQAALSGFKLLLKRYEREASEQKPGYTKFLIGLDDLLESKGISAPYKGR